MFWLLVTGLWAAMLLSPFFLLFLFLPSGRDCPRCASETVSIRWEGVTRTAVMRRPLPKLEVVPDDKSDSDEDAPWRG